MFKNMKLGAKIATGFGILIAIAVILGITAVVNMNSARNNAIKVRDEYVRENGIVSQIERSALKLMFHMRGYAFTEDNKFLGLSGEESTRIKEWLDKAKTLSEKYPELVVLGKNTDEIKSKMTDYETLVKSTSEKINAIEEARKTMDTAASAFINECNAYLGSQSKSFEKEMDIEADAAHLKARFRKTKMINDIIDLGNDIRIHNFKSQALRKPDIIKSKMSGFDEMDKIINELRKVTKLQAGLKELDKISNASLTYKKALEGYLKNWAELNAVGEKRDTTGLAASALAEETAIAGGDSMEKVSDDSVSSLKISSVILSIGLVIAFSVGCFLSFFITVSITGPVRRVVVGLKEGASQVASAAGQVAGASQSLAEGASEQAASLEETSSSIEEMSSMTRHNADNASLANGLMREANTVVSKALKFMTALTESIGEISAASNQTQKIIKTIDEIAFQTNLLALNAAVEAARAGEAGAGFAVVAGEVRNLAMRSAEAAKTTAEMIENTVKKVTDGTTLLEQTNSAFREVTTSASKVGHLVKEIASASAEQAKGIDQVNRAVTEIDKITQQNAANAEESASASEELSAQSQQMMEYVSQLTAIVGGANPASLKSDILLGSKRKIVNQGSLFAKVIGKGSDKNSKTVHDQVDRNAREIRPDQIIPMGNDDDYQDF